MATFGGTSIVVWGGGRWALPLLSRLVATTGASGDSLTFYFFDPKRGGEELSAALSRHKAVWIVVRPEIDELLTLHSWWRKLPASDRIEVVVAECNWSDVLRVGELVRQLPRWPRVWLPPVRDESPAPSGLSLLWDRRSAARSPRGTLSLAVYHSLRGSAPDEVRPRAPLFRP